MAGTEAQNKITYGIQDVHVAKILTDTAGSYTCGTPYALPGAQKISLEPQGDMIQVYADNMEYFTSPNNQGYEGTLTFTELLEQFVQDALGESLESTDGVLVESQDAKQGKFALMFQFEGDAKAVRHVIYNCTADRPKIESETATGSISANATELTLKIAPRTKDRRVKAKTTKTTTQSIYDGWYGAVYGVDVAGS